MTARPTALDAERSLLGALITDPGRIGDAVAVVRPEDFHAPTHAALFRLLVAMAKAGEPVDVVTLHGRMETAAERYGGLGYVITLPEACPSPAATPHYARLVKSAASRRRLMDLGERIVEQAATAQDVAWTIAQAQQEIARVEGGDTMHGLDEVLDDAIGGMQAVHEGTATPGLSSGYYDLDDKIGGGFRPGELTILAARPAMGKTALAMNFAVRVSATCPVVVFSMEMRRQQLVTRMVPMFSGVPLDRVVDARKLSARDWDAIVAGRERFRALPLWIDDTPGLSLEQLTARARSQVARGAGLIVVDYLTQMRVEGRNAAQEVGRNANGLKQLARELEVPVICLAQLNRAVETRAIKRPTMSDLRDSGEVEQAADLVLFVYRHHYYEPEEGNPEEMTIIAAKARMGQTGDVVLKWKGAQQLVEDGGPL